MMFWLHKRVLPALFIVALALGVAAIIGQAVNRIGPNTAEATVVAPTPCTTQEPWTELANGDLEVKTLVSDRNGIWSASHADSSAEAKTMWVKIVDYNIDQHWLTERDFERMIPGRTTYLVPAECATQFKSWFLNRASGSTATDTSGTPASTSTPTMPEKHNDRRTLPIALALGLALVGTAYQLLNREHQRRSPFTSPPVLPDGIVSLEHAGSYVAAMYQDWRLSLPPEEQAHLPATVTLTGRRVDIEGRCRIRNSTTGAWDEKNLRPAVCVFEFRDQSGNVLCAVEQCGNPLRSQTGGFSPLPTTQVRPCVHHAGSEHQTTTVAAWPPPDPTPAPAPAVAESIPVPVPTVAEPEATPVTTPVVSGGLPNVATPGSITIKCDDVNVYTVTTSTGTATVESTDPVVVTTNDGSTTVTIGTMVFTNAPANPTA